MTLDDIGGWFCEQNRRNLDRLIREHQVRSVLEIGSFLGLSAAWFADRVEHVTCIDLWCEPATHDSNNNLVATLRNNNLPTDFYHLFEQNLRAYGVWDKITVIRGNSHDPAIAAQVPAYDLVYIDGDHSPKGCASDLELYADRARCVVCGDDFVAIPEFGVIEAVTHHVRQFMLKVDAPFWWVEK